MNLSQIKQPPIFLPLWKHLEWLNTHYEVIFCVGFLGEQAVVE